MALVYLTVMSNPILDAAKSFGQLFSKGTGQLLVLLAATVGGTVWVTLQVRNVEKTLDSRFNSFEARLGDAWTVQMMAARDKIVAEWNPTNRVPDAYRIFYDVKAGREPVAIRIGP